jgi:leucyl aminopeptidase
LQPEIVPHKDSAATVACDAVVVGALSTGNGSTLTPEGAEIDAALEGALSDHISESSFKARVGDVLIAPALGKLAARSVVVAGLGKKKEVSPSDIRRASANVARRLSERGVIASTLHTATNGVTRAAAEGYLLGSYSFTKYKSDPRPSKIGRILFLGNTEGDEIEHARISSDATALARDLINEPAAVLTPDALARKAQEVADVGGIDCEVFDEKELRRRGFGGILGVAQGSAQPPRFIQLRSAPPNAKGKVVLVGKGITFDSGGLSLKDAKNMETMKTDMSGAAAVVGAMSAIPRLGVPIEVLGLISATENMPGDGAIKPGDVITHYGGRTSEVLNTDAEGRLVLADALAFACEQEPDAIVDVATLTGGMMIALGRKVAGIFANEDDLREELIEAAQTAGERLWPMPLVDDYRSDIDSEIADIKNTGSRYGSPIYGGLFLRDFVSKEIPWAHIDIAGPARAEKALDEVSRGGTGFATRTLIAWVERRGS